MTEAASDALSKLRLELESKAAFQVMERPLLTLLTLLLLVIEEDEDVTRCGADGIAGIDVVEAMLKLEEW